MRRAIDAKAAGTWGSVAQATVTLAFEDRYRRRIRMQDDAGEAFLLDLGEATVLRDGDGLVLQEGGVIAVRAADERVADITASSAVEAIRIAWHIGNRHTPMQVLADSTLRIAYDHVLVAMAEGLGAEVVERQACFQPEGGAYAAGHGHDHDHR